MNLSLILNAIHLCIRHNPEYDTINQRESTTSFAIDDLLTIISLEEEEKEKEDVRDVRG